MKELLQRTSTAVVFTLVFLGAILLGKITFILLCFAIMIGCLWEYYGFFDKTEHPAMKTRGFFLAVVVFVFTVLYAISMSNLAFFSLLIPVFFLLPLSALWISQKEAIISSTITLWGIFYCVVPVCLFLWIAFIDHHHYKNHIILGSIFFIWVNDTGAYIFGKILGRHRMFEKISPGKTWEGFMGGAVCALLLGVFIGNYFSELGRIHWMVLSIIVVISGTLGDLVESLYKRELKVKDSGKFFPGHGGMLDRFDSFLMAAPFIYIFLVLVKY